MYKRRLMLLLIITVTYLTGCSTVQSNKVSLGQETQEYEVHKTTNKIKNITEIELILDTEGPYWNEVKPISITDDKMIYDIMSMIEESKLVTDESKIHRMSGVARKKNKLIATGIDGSKKEINFAYDTLYEIGYLEADGKKVEPDYNFFRYISDLNEYTNPNTNIEQPVLQLFDKYNWTVDYKINTLDVKLIRYRPQDLFRPAPDNEINDTGANLTFNDSVSSEYKTWFNSTYRDRFYLFDFYS